ncbi:uncharacterized protein CEXT_77471 [Caerostris extrusa]|uniref:TIL domain-containing protein n=1 Tax=Caerostris extrusa TaxID=172846 RepID=A0AAV4Y6I7_CAEEX|nr:uncharacterized protein CEXT_77471 [Caerostris extrusa]
MPSFQNVPHPAALHVRTLTLHPVWRCCVSPDASASLDFVEDSDGKCVHLEHCSKNCRHPDEEFQECGKSCPDTCENKGHPLSKSCPYRCNRGCFCKEGLYRTKEGTCVPLKDCPVEVTTVPTPKNPPAVKLPDDCHGCPDRSACDVFCKTMGVYTGLCTGEGHLHCRCT